MPQVSRPLLIALIAVVGFAGAWMTVLKKHATSSGGGSQPTAKAPGTAGLGRAIDRANGAVATSQASAARAEQAAGQPAATTTPAPAAAAATPAPAPVAKTPTVKTPAANTLSVPKSAALVPRTTVLLFAGRGADDAEARAVVRSIRSSRVHTVIAPLSAVARYAQRYRGVQVTATPAIFVIGSDRTAQQIVGLPDREQVLAAVADRSAG